MVLVTGLQPLSLLGWGHLSLLTTACTAEAASSLPQVSKPWYPKEGDGNFHSIDCVCQVVEVGDEADISGIGEE